jgi:poly-D-alanine transfer protein DltD
VDYIFKFGQQFNENDVRRAIIHELQHAVEHNYDKTKLLSEKEQTKKQNWIESYHEKHPDNDRTLDVEYINTPTEIRATLAEIFASLDLPQNKETVKEELGKPTYENLKQLIENHERWGRFKYMSPKAIRYMIDELYKAIY